MTEICFVIPVVGARSLRMLLTLPPNRDSMFRHRYLLSGLNFDPNTSNWGESPASSNLKSFDQQQTYTEQHNERACHRNVTRGPRRAITRTSTQCPSAAMETAVSKAEERVSGAITASGTNPSERSVASTRNPTMLDDPSNRLSMASSNRTPPLKALLLCDRDAPDRFVTERARSHE